MKNCCSVVQALGSQTWNRLVWDGSWERKFAAPSTLSKTAVLLLASDSDKTFYPSTESPESGIQDARGRFVAWWNVNHTRHQESNVFCSHDAAKQENDELQRTPCLVACNEDSFAEKRRRPQSRWSKEAITPQRAVRVRDLRTWALMTSVQSDEGRWNKTLRT